jgi:hypothetical protein
MMKTIDVLIPIADTTGSVYISVKDPCRIVSGIATNSHDCSSDSTAVMNVGKGTDYVLDFDMEADIGVPVKATMAATTEDHINQIFGPDEPIKVTLTNAVANNITSLQLVVDPFLIGKHSALATA